AVGCGAGVGSGEGFTFMPRSGAPTGGHPALRPLSCVLPSEDQGAAAHAGAEVAARAVGQRQLAVGDLHSRVGLSSQLADGFDDLGDPAPVVGMVVAEAAAV